MIWLTPHIESDGITYYAMTKSLVQHGAINIRNVPPAIRNLRRTISLVNGKPGFLYSCGYALCYYPFMKVSALLPIGLDSEVRLGRHPAISTRDTIGITMGTVCYTLLALLFCYLLLARYVRPWLASVIVFSLYLGTPFFYYSQHSPAYPHAVTICLITMALYLFDGILRDRGTYIHFILLGAVTGCIILVKNFNIIYTAGFFLYFLVRRDAFSKENVRRLLFFSLGLLPFIVILGAYNHQQYGQVLTCGYLHMAHDFRHMDTQFSLNTFNLHKYFLAPSRGLIWWAPIMLFAFMGLYVMKTTGSRWLYPCLAVTILLFAWLNFYTLWHGGTSFGPRLLINLFPFLCIMLSALAGKHRKTFLVIMTVCLVYTLLLSQAFIIYDKALACKQDRRVLCVRKKVAFDVGPIGLLVKVGKLRRTKQARDFYYQYLFARPPVSMLHLLLP